MNTAAIGKRSAEMGAVLLLALVGPAAQPGPPTPAENAIPVTADNFVRAETDRSFALVAQRDALGKFVHVRELPLEGSGVRPNRDTLSSAAVFDLDAGPVTITMPNAGKRFMSMMVIDQDHYVRDVFYGSGAHTYARRQIGTRYVFVALRTLVNPADAEDVKQAHALQDAVRVKQQSAGRFESPSWDQASQNKVRYALLALNATLPDLRRAFGARNEVDPVRHLIGTAAAWGGTPDKHAIDLNATPARNDGSAVYRLNVKDVPVDAFWSVIVYDADGHLRKNRYDAYALNGITAKRGDDGGVTIQFGACDGKIVNCLPTMSGWNYTVRLYRPRPAVLNGSWKFPEAQLVE